MDLQEAIDMAGGRVHLAITLGVTESTTYKWERTLPEDRYHQLAGLYFLKKWKPVDGRKFPKR